MSRTIVIAIFISLIIFIFADQVYNFNSLVKAVAYGGMFVVGMVIYLLRNGFSFPKDNDKI